MRRHLRLLPLFSVLLFQPATGVAQNPEKEAQLFQGAAGSATPFRNVPVTGFTRDGKRLSGSLDIEGFINDAGVLKAVGILRGTLFDPHGGTTEFANEVVQIPVHIPRSAASFDRIQPNQVPIICSVLNLVLGPLDLNLLGLTVHLNQVVLTINAVPGAGNLLGNLLCAIANLLNGVSVPGNLVASLTALLNTLLALLATL